MFASVQPPSASHKYKYLSQTQFQVQTQPQVLFSNTNSRLKYKLTDQPQPQMFSTYGIMTDNQSSKSLSTLAGRGIKSQFEMLPTEVFSCQLFLTIPDICHAITTADCAKKDKYQVCFSPNHFKFKVEILSKLKKPTTTDIKKRQIPTSTCRSSHGSSCQKNVLNKHIQKGPKVQNLVIVTTSFMWQKLNQD